MISERSGSCFGCFRANVCKDEDVMGFVSLPTSYTTTMHHGYLVLVPVPVPVRTLGRWICYVDM